MNGGLLKSASAVAIIAAAGLFGAMPAKAADLGGDCCADLEERVAELEATTVRKGNRKVSLSISGYVSHHVMFWDDGTQSDMYIGDGGNYGSRWRFTGSAKITPSVTAGFLYEFAQNGNSLASFNQLNGGDDLGASGGAACTQTGNSSGTVGCNIIRQSTVWLEHKQLGRVTIGQGSTSTDDLVLIDLGGLAGAATPDVGLYMGGFLLRGNNGLLARGDNNATTQVAGATWTSAIRGHESWDTNRRNIVRYDTPALFGFTLSGAVGEDNFWDVALRYAGEFNGIRIAGGIGYLQDTKFNEPNQKFDQAGLLCQNTTTQTATASQRAGNCDTKVTDLKGSLSVLHTPTGLFVTGAAGKRELSGTNTAITNTGAGVAGAAVFGAYTGPDVTFWWLSGGLQRNFFGIGNTVLYGEYGEHKGGLGQAAALNLVTNFDARFDSKVTSWGLGVVQNIDAAAMEIFVAYKNFSLETNGFIGNNVTLNSNAVGVHDIQSVTVGTRIQF